jgi:hypothetical protein
MLVKYTITQGNEMIKYSWRPATGDDIAKIVAMAEQHFQTEIDQIFKPEPITYARNVTFAVVNQYYNPRAELLSIAEDDAGTMIAYTWAKSGDYAAWSDNEMVSVRMAHVDLTLSPRDRIRIIQDMINLWEGWATIIKVPIICSTTMRNDQAAFLRLHAKNGYDVRGSYAYKKLSTEQTGLPIP